MDIRYVWLLKRFSFVMVHLLVCHVPLLACRCNAPGDSWHFMHTQGAKGVHGLLKCACTGCSNGCTHRLEHGACSRDSVS